MDLVEFLRARLDEDEKIARAAEMGWLRVRRDGDDERVARSGWRSLPLARSSETGMYPETLLHAAFHGPARVLADVEAKRRIIDDVIPVLTGMEEMVEGEWNSSPDGVWPLLALLALPYASHPDYREEWKP